VPSQPAVAATARTHRAHPEQMPTCMVRSPVRRRSHGLHYLSTRGAMNMLLANNTGAAIGSTLILLLLNR
jgi:hypothetical protein